MSATILVWMLSLNREYSAEEYNQAYQLCRRCFPNERFRYQTTDPDSFRLLMTQILPIVMMRYYRVPHSRWNDHKTPAGKHWIDIIPNSDRPHPSSVGYHLTYENSLCGMACTTGSRAQVVRIGLGIKELKIEPKGMSVNLYLEYLSHRLTQVERDSVTGESDDIMLKRLCILLALKQAYLNAIGESFGFDFKRLEFDLPQKRVLLDEFPLVGWEFLIFMSRLGVARGDTIKSEEYTCVRAFYNGTLESTYSFLEEPKNWVKYIDLDEFVNIIPKLSQ